MIGNDEDKEVDERMDERTGDAAGETATKDQVLRINGLAQFDRVHIKTLKCEGR